jgi:hypothetical protein
MCRHALDDSKLMRKINAVRMIQLAASPEINSGPAVATLVSWHMHRVFVHAHFFVIYESNGN